MEEDSITIIVVRQSEKIRTVKIAPQKLYVFLAGLTGLIFAFLIVLYGYVSAYKENAGLANTVQSILQAREISPPEAEQPPKREEMTAQPLEDTASTVTTTSLIAVASSSGQDMQSDKISIDQFQMTRSEEPHGLKFIFRLNNIEKDGLLSGYLAIKGNDDSRGINKFRIYPETAVYNENGELVNHKRGEWFSIRKFKYVQGILPIGGQIQKYAELTVSIYADNGELMYRRTFDVTSG